MRRIGTPYFARPTRQLADPDVALLAGGPAELARGQIETQQRTGTEIAHPNNVVLIDIDPIGRRPITG
jgi:hypothetical protein